MIQANPTAVFALFAAMVFLLVAAAIIAVHYAEKCATLEKRLALLSTTAKALPKAGPIKRAFQRPATPAPVQDTGLTLLQERPPTFS